MRHTLQKQNEIELNLTTFFCPTKFINLKSIFLLKRKSIVSDFAIDFFKNVINSVEKGVNKKSHSEAEKNPKLFL